jgi:hypothetical protein
MKEFFEKPQQNGFAGHLFHAVGAEFVQPARGFVR